MVWYGGFTGALLLIVIEIKRRALPLGEIADLCSPTLAVGYAVGRMGCFLVGDDYGRPTDSWVGISFPRGTPPTRVDVLESYFNVQVDPAIIERFGQVVPVHPTQLYEIAMASIIFVVLWKLRVHEHGAGWLWWICLTLLSAERFLVEFVRVKDDRFLGPLTLAQGIAVTLVLVGVWGMRRAGPRAGSQEEKQPDASGRMTDHADDPTRLGRTLWQTPSAECIRRLARPSPKGDARCHRLGRRFHAAGQGTRV